MNLKHVILFSSSLVAASLSVSAAPDDLIAHSKLEKGLVRIFRGEGQPRMERGVKAERMPDGAYR